jgi:hypothetical protein
MQKNKTYKTVAALSRILICMNNCMTICCLIEKKKKREKFREIIHIYMNESPRIKIYKQLLLQLEYKNEILKKVCVCMLKK